MAGSSTTSFDDVVDYWVQARQTLPYLYRQDGNGALPRGPPATSMILFIRAGPVYARFALPSNRIMPGVACLLIICS